MRFSGVVGHFVFISYSFLFPQFTQPLSLATGGLNNQPGRFRVYSKEERDGRIDVSHTEQASKRGSEQEGRQADRQAEGNTQEERATVCAQVYQRK
jgi:hypothetical protein